MLDPSTFRDAVVGFVRHRSTNKAGEYTMCSDGHVTLYSSCFAAMTLHYLNAVHDLAGKERLAWAAYIKQWQDPESGRFIGPEIVAGELTSTKHDWDHLTKHLTAHALPALHLLGELPPYPLRFAHPFLDPETLLRWLNQRDWRQAWLEGNNLLFAGQFLIYLRDFEGRDEAQSALETLFDWLDAHQDPATGLWGTNGYCDSYPAMYGGYHQLLLYYYCKRPLPFAERLIDLTLALQHSDGSFTRQGGGGACEDADGVDILVNHYKRTGFRQRAVCTSLARVVDHILKQHMEDGGFVYRRGVPFSHMGIKRTYVPANTSDMFSTWFRVHTIALACQVLHHHPLAEISWRFNDTCSMGWHHQSPLPTPQGNPLPDFLPFSWRRLSARVLRAVKTS